MECDCVVVIHDDIGIGMKLGGLPPESMPVRLGLMKGDIIRRTNGVPTDSAESARALGLDAQSAALRKLELTRGGRELAIIYRDR